MPDWQGLIAIMGSKDTADRRLRAPSPRWRIEPNSSVAGRERSLQRQPEAASGTACVGRRSV